MDSTETTTLAGQERPLQHEVHLGKLAAAMALLQAKLGGMEASGTNPHYKSAYSTLEDAWKAVRAALPGTGLSVVQWPIVREGTAGVTTFLLHESGEWMRGELLLPFDGGRGSQAQAAGSAITYARRYSLTAILGLATEDDDAEGTRPAKRKKRQSQASRDAGDRGHEHTPRRAGSLTKAQAAEIEALGGQLRALGDKPEALGEFIRSFGARSLADLDLDQAEEVLHILRAEVEKRAGRDHEDALRDQKAEELRFAGTRVVERGQADPYAEPQMHGAE